MERFVVVKVKSWEAAAEAKKLAETVRADEPVSLIDTAGGPEVVVRTSRSQELVDQLRAIGLEAMEVDPSWAAPAITDSFENLAATFRGVGMNVGLLHDVLAIPHGVVFAQVEAGGCESERIVATGNGEG